MIPPDALDWHPWYHDKRWLLEWLDSDDIRDLTVHVRRVMRFGYVAPEAPIAAARKGVAILRKETAAGPAPHVGSPFWYEWNVATDQYGRFIAGESRIAYRQG